MSKISDAEKYKISIYLSRGVIFIVIAAFVVYAMFFHKGVKEFFEVKKCNEPSK